MKVLKFRYAGSVYADPDSERVVFKLQAEDGIVFGVELSVDDAAQLAGDVAEQTRIAKATPN